MFGVFLTFFALLKNGHGRGAELCSRDIGSDHSAVKEDRQKRVRLV